MSQRPEILCRFASKSFSVKTKEFIFQHYILTKFSCCSLKILVDKEENFQNIRENVVFDKKKSAYVIYEWSQRKMMLDKSVVGSEANRQTPPGIPLLSEGPLTTTDDDAASEPSGIDTSKSDSFQRMRRMGILAFTLIR